MENEKRLIDANALSDKVDESKYDNPYPQGVIRVTHRNEHDHFLRMILDAPTVDAVEVVHGRWLTDRFGLERSICSVCDACYEGDGGNYCRRCGAKMDGGNEDV